MWQIHFTPTMFIRTKQTETGSQILMKKISKSCETKYVPGNYSSIKDKSPLDSLGKNLKLGLFRRWLNQILI